MYVYENRSINNIDNNEKWKMIEDYSNYEISNYGRVKSLRRNRILHQTINNMGILIIRLKSDIDNKFHTLLIRNLVANAFIDNPNKYTKVIHLNKDELDNHYKNLQFMSNKDFYNQKDRVEAISKRMLSGNNGMAITIRCINDNKVFPTKKEAAIYYNISTYYIDQSLKGKNKNLKFEIVNNK